MVRLDVRGTSREQQTIELREDFARLERLRQDRDQDRQGASGTRHRMRILLPDHVKRMGANHSAVGRNSDERTTGHAGDGSEIGPERS
jgi:hypothetical protein